MKNIFKNNKGITLIALIITIIVLLILAGVTIAAITGNESAMNKATQAKEANERGAEMDAISVAAISAVVEGNYNLEADLTTLQNSLVDLIDEDPEEVIIGEGPWVVTGKTSKTKYIIDNQGEVYRNDAPEGVTVPQGFVASHASGEDTVDGGLVIYEGTTPVTNANVEEARRTRNQFVWVPVAAEGLTYAKDTTYSNTYGIYQSNYKNYTWNDNVKTANSTSSDLSMSKNEQSVAKYGGFYIGRYEAGFPGNASLKDGKVVFTPLKAGDSYPGKDNAQVTVSGTTANRLPEIKKGYATWDRVSQTSAKLASENLYSSNTDVRSQLIDSYAWDTTVNWLKKAGIVTEYDTTNHYINSKTYGNYLDSEFSIPNVLYLPHIYYKDKKSTAPSSAGSTAWGWASRYIIGSLETVKAVDDRNKRTDITHANYDSVYVKASLSTGAVDNTKTKNIYDLAGNLWEWTTEEGDRNTSDQTFTVFRGGSFYNSGNINPVVYRNGGYYTSDTGVNIGFRVVLYLE